MFGLLFEGVIHHVGERSCARKRSSGGITGAGHIVSAFRNQREGEGEMTHSIPTFSFLFHPEPGPWDGTTHLGKQVFSVQLILSGHTLADMSRCF